MGRWWAAILLVTGALTAAPRAAHAEDGRLFLHVVRGPGAVDLPWDTVAGDDEWWRALGVGGDARRLRRLASSMANAPVGTRRNTRLSAAGEATLEVRPDGRLTEALLLSWLVEAVERAGAPGAP